MSEMYNITSTLIGFFFGSLFVSIRQGSCKDLKGFNFAFFQGNAEPLTLACAIGTKANRYKPFTTPAGVKPSNLGGTRKRPTELCPAVEDLSEEINTIPETCEDSEDVN